MSYTIDGHLITININPNSIYLLLDNIYETNIDDMPYGFTIDKFHDFIIKCFEKSDNYFVKINDNIISLSFRYNDFNIGFDINFKKKINQELLLEIDKLKSKVRNLEETNDMLSMKINKIFDMELLICGKYQKVFDNKIDISECVNVYQLYEINKHLSEINEIKINCYLIANIRQIETRIDFDYFGYIIKSNNIEKISIVNNLNIVDNSITIDILCGFYSRYFINKTVFDIYNIDIYISDKIYIFENMNIKFNNCIFYKKGKKIIQHQDILNCFCNFRNNITIM